MTKFCNIIYKSLFIFSDRTREKAEGYDKLKELCEKLKADLEQKTRRIEELEKEVSF